MSTCPICGGKKFAVYDDCNQGMCLHCEAVLFDFDTLEKVDSIVNAKDNEQNMGQVES